MDDLHTLDLVLDIAMIVVPIALVVLFLGTRGRSTADHRTAQRQALQEWATILVAAAEQIYQSSDQRYRYVLAHLADKFPQVNDQDRRAVLEWAYHLLKLQQAAAQPAPPLMPLGEVQEAKWAETPPLDVPELARLIAAEIKRLETPLDNGQ